MLPGLNISFDNGNIGSVVSTADGVFGLLSSAVAVPETFALNTVYTVKGMADVANLGILPDVDNYVLYKKLKNFYEQAGEGSELWLMGFAKNTKPSDWFTADAVTGKAPVQKLLDASKGKISLLFTAFSPDAAYVQTLENGLDQDVWVAKQKAQLFAENYVTSDFTPLIVILEGYAFDGDDIALPDLHEGDENRVGIFIGEVEPRTGDVAVLGASNESLAGRLAAIQVHENPGKVKLGALETLTAYIVDEPVENYDVAALHDKGYITFRTHVRKAGYYISDDPLATAKDDDYSNITLRRVIDKAFKIAFNIASNEVLEDFDLNNDGTISPFYAKSVEGDVEREIYNLMTQRGELSVDKTDKNDLGVRAKFNTAINVAQTDRLEMVLSVRPKGYARWFDILLGYSVNLNN